MMVAEAHGPLERFAEAFDIEEYQRRKWVMFQRLITMIRSRKPNGETVLEYLDLRGFERPAGATVAGTLLAWSKWFS